MAKPLVEVLKVGRRGEIVLPARLRRSLRIREGDELILSVEERRMVLERRARHFGAYLDVMASSTGGSSHEE